MKVFITGSAGFIGFHLAKLLLENGHQVHGFDLLTNYYDIKLKNDRRQILGKFSSFSDTVGDIIDSDHLVKEITAFSPDAIVHLAAQAGVRYSLENPRSYIDTNVVGTFNVLEAAKITNVKHLLMASTSSVYGGNTEMPFSEGDRTDHQLTVYAATKKATESLGHTYAHLWKIPVTMFRFFTVYGPWGRPDMALFKFVDAILDGRPIDIYNNGEMYRDFTYVEDLVKSIMLLLNVPPGSTLSDGAKAYDNLSSVAPFRVVNIGNSQKVRLMDFITEAENALDMEATKNFMPMQTGDVPATLADVRLLQELIFYQPDTNIKAGVKNFVRWFREYYRK